MGLSFRQLHPTFVAEVSGVELRTVQDEPTLAALRDGMDRFGVLIFHDQPFTDAEQLDFAQRLDGQLHTRQGARTIKPSRFGNEALSDISNIDENGDIMDSNDRRRAYNLGNRLWHTDASFVDPGGRFSLLSARDIPPVPNDTEFADTRGAYDALPEETKALIAGLQAHHSIAHSRETLGFEFSSSEAEQLKGATHPLVRTNPNTGRKSLYVASHASRIIDWPVPEGRLLLRELIEHATQPQFVHRHVWRDGDLVIWDNRATMHRGTRYDDTKYRRELRRVTTLDVARPLPPQRERAGARVPAVL